MRHSHLPSKLRAVVTGGRGQGGKGAAGAGRRGGPFACGTSDWHFKELALFQKIASGSGDGRRRTGAGKTHRVRSRRGARIGLSMLHPNGAAVDGKKGRQTVTRGLWEGPMRR
ncbi:hypothetical protein [Azospirillum palustre]